MKPILSTVCCIALCSMPGLAKEKKVAEAAAMTDQQFVDFAAQTDMVEANLGQLAESTASAQPVKDYGQMLATDHTKDFHQLYDVAQQASLKMPDAIDAEHPALKSYAEQTLPTLQKHLDGAKALEKAK
jgi:putative membrane protein